MSDKATEVTTGQVSRVETLAKTVVENRGVIGDAMQKAGYSKAYSTNPKQIVATKKFQQAIQKYLPKDKQDVAVIESAYKAKRKEEISWSELHGYLETSLKLKGYLDKDKGDNRTQVAIVVER